jgi:leucyl-tRNA synthetase
MQTYDFRALEQKWRPRWEQADLHRAQRREGREKAYILDFFPYPSGAGLSVGHCRNYVPTCVAARFERMRGKDVLHPMGWDAFGLPAESYAIRHGVQPRDSSRAFSANYRRQLQLIACSYDWSREIDSSTPGYYRWTQWFFVLLFERGLAYQADGEQWWCASCKTILANEQVEHGKCWRCSGEVTKKELRQWYFRITAYAERLRADLERLQWPERIKRMQANWIGGMHDWLISRQRYWGAPIPIVHCPTCGPVAVPASQLPVELPETQDFQPNDDGRSPLSRLESWVATSCPRCSGPARRETDTMDGFACSSWYFLRFASPDYEHGPFDPRAVSDWLPVDTYVGGAEHAVMHLLYVRFWTKVMFDAGLIDFDEPFPRLLSQGVLHAASDGRRMSKSRGNVVTPDEVVARHGVDALRAYVLFLGPFDGDVTWSDDNICGIERFLRRVWQLATTPHAEGTAYDADFERERHRVIARVTTEFEAFEFNTAIAGLMEYASYLARAPAVPAAQWAAAVESLTLLLAPICPFIAEEIWAQSGHSASIQSAPWPSYDPALAQSELTTIVVMIDGKVRERLNAPRGLSEDALRERALAAVESQLQGRAPRQVIVVPDRLVNVVL